MADGTGDLDSEEEQSEEEEDSSSENEEAADSCRLHVDAGIPLPPPPIGPRPGEGHVQGPMYYVRPLEVSYGWCLTGPIILICKLAIQIKGLYKAFEGPCLVRPLRSLRSL